MTEQLTNRELEVLKLLACGYSNKRIMQELVIELSTLKQHLTNIYLKLNLQRKDDKYLNNEYTTMRVQAALFYWQNFNNGRIVINDRK